MPERNAAQAALAVRDRIEHRGRRLVGPDLLALERENRRDRGRDLARERNLDEDQRVIDQRGMKEGVAAAVGRIDAMAQIVPVADLMHRLIADDLLEHARRRRPVDAPQHQKAAIEPRREHVHEVVVDDFEIAAAVERIEQMLAHAHQCGGAAGREIQPAQEFLPARLGRLMNPRRGVIGWIGAPHRDGGVELAMIGTEATRQRLEERDARPRGQLGIVGQNLARERDTGGFAAPGEKLVAQLHQARRALFRALAALTGAVEERAPALRDALQKLAKKGGVHSTTLSLIRDIKWLSLPNSTNRRKHFGPSLTATRYGQGGAGAS